MKNDSAIVTGGSRGIGKAIAIKFAKEGMNVVITGRDEKAIRKVQEEIKSYGVECHYFLGNVQDTTHADHVIKSTIDAFGKIDTLINNAGFGILKKFIDSSISEFRDQMDVNVFGVYNFTKAAVPYMIKASKGNIINIASLAGKNNFVGGTMYSATKHALLGFTKSLMLELREYNIRVASVCPGSVETEFGKHTPGHQSKSKILYAEDVADSVYAIINLPENALLSDLDLRPTNPGK
jgi:3-oxoacyl-[acyl-carrier protein] reductase